MKRLLLALLLAFAPVEASAQLLTAGVSNTTTGGGGSYTGPGDVVGSAVTWYGLRAYNAAQAALGVAAVQLCTAADAACTDIHVTSTGILNSANLVSAGCSAIDTCTAKIIYDQSGALSCTSSTACDLTQATIASRATFKNSCTGGGKPCLVFAGSASYPLSSGPNQAQPLTISFYAERTGATSSFNEVAASTEFTTGFSNSADTLFEYDGTGIIHATGTDNTFHAAQNVANGASSLQYVDGSATTGTLGAGHFNMGSAVFGSGLLGNLTGQLTEVGIWGSAFSGGEQSGMNSNETGYY
jgi:hypothetical protein